MSSSDSDFDLSREIEAARAEGRPYRIDKSKLTEQERQLLRMRSRAIPLVAESLPLDIVFEDDTFLVVSKPPDLKMHPSHRFLGGSLLNRAIGHLGYAPRIVHRLDMVRFYHCLAPPHLRSISISKSLTHSHLLYAPIPIPKFLAYHWCRKSHYHFTFHTPVLLSIFSNIYSTLLSFINYAEHSPQVVLAKKKKVCTSIMKQFEKGLVSKQYLCIVDGTLPQPLQSSFNVDAPIQRHEIPFKREVGDSREDSKSASTQFTILHKSDTANMMLLKAAPKTGRTHQIRLHALHSRLPIVGDDLYNPKECVIRPLSLFVLLFLLFIYLLTLLFLFCRHDLYESYEQISKAAKDESLQLFADGNSLRKGLKLHAWKISFINPENDQPISFCAPPPVQFCSLLDHALLSMPN